MLFMFELLNFFVKKNFRASSLNFLIYLLQTRSGMNLVTIYIL